MSNTETKRAFNKFKMCGEVILCNFNKADQKIILKLCGHKKIKFLENGKTKGKSILCQNYSVSRQDIVKSELLSQIDAKEFVRLIKECYAK